jgi:hypothetical protein
MESNNYYSDEASSAYYSSETWLTIYYSWMTSNSPFLIK